MKILCAVVLDDAQLRAMAGHATPATMMQAFPPKLGKESPRKWAALAAWWKLYGLYQRIMNSDCRGHRTFREYNRCLAAAGIPEITPWLFIATSYLSLHFSVEGKRIRLKELPQIGQQKLL